MIQAKDVIHHKVLHLCLQVTSVTCKITVKQNKQKTTKQPNNNKVNLKQENKRISILFFMVGSCFKQAFITWFPLNP